MKLPTARRVAHYAPILATIMGVSSSLGQIIRMCSEQSALGQEPMSWVLAQANWWMWVWIHRTLNPKQTFVVWNAYLGAALSAAVFCVVIYWRYLA